MASVSSATRFVDTACVNPKVLQVIASGLFSAESDLVKASLIRFIPIHHVSKGDLPRSPCVREYSMYGEIVDELRQGEIAIVIML